jgi:protein-S-isoprenylcysteine O-methyltransferase Ste14
MATLALVLYGLYVALGFGLRSLIQLRRTGSTGFRGIARRSGPAEWIAGVGFTVAVLLGVAAPILALLDRVEPISSLDTSVVHVLGIVLALLGIAGTLYAQLAMGKSWRIGVDPEERTELVAGGPFALVRNPIYSALLATALGLALLVPSWIAIAGLVGVVVALELQVRAVEEPYMLRVHGDAYADYAARVGRFVPGVGRIGKSA